MHVSCMKYSDLFCNLTETSSDASFCWWKKTIVPCSDTWWCFKLLPDSSSLSIAVYSCLARHQWHGELSQQNKPAHVSTSNLLQYTVSLIYNCKIVMELIFFIYSVFFGTNLSHTSAWYIDTRQRAGRYDNTVF